MTTLKVGTHIQVHFGSWTTRTYFKDMDGGILLRLTSPSLLETKRFGEDVQAFLPQTFKYKPPHLNDALP
jgi:hypothetical protein